MSVIVTGLPLVVASLSAAATFVWALLSVSLPLSLPAVAALSLPALLLSPALVLPLLASTPARPFGLPLLSVPLPVVFVPPVLSLSPVLFVPGLLPLGASIFMVLPVLPLAPVLPAVPLFVSTLALSLPTGAATFPALSPLVVPVCAAGPPPLPVPAVPSVPIPVPAVPPLPLLPLSVTLPLQLSVKAGAVAFLFAVVAPAPWPFGWPPGARRPSGCPGEKDKVSSGLGNGLILYRYGDTRLYIVLNFGYLYMSWVLSFPVCNWLQARCSIGTLKRKSNLYKTSQTGLMTAIPGAPSFHLPPFLCDRRFLFRRLLHSNLPRPGLHLLVNILLHRHWDTGEQSGEPLQFGQEGAQHLSDSHHTAASCLHVQLLQSNGGRKAHKTPSIKR